MRQGIRRLSGKTLRTWKNGDSAVGTWYFRETLLNTSLTPEPNQILYAKFTAQVKGSWYFLRLLWFCIWSLYYIGTYYRKLRVAKRTRKFRKKRWYMVYCVKNANIFCHMSPLYSSGFSHVFVRLEIVWTVQQVWRPSRIVKVVNNVKASNGTEYRYTTLYDV